MYLFLGDIFCVHIFVFTSSSRRQTFKLDGKKKRNHRRRRRRRRREREGEKRHKKNRIILLSLRIKRTNKQTRKRNALDDAGFAAAEKQTTETTESVGVVLVFRDGGIYTRVRAETKFYQARIAIAFAREKRADVRCALAFECVSVRRKKARVVIVLVER